VVGLGCIQLLHLLVVVPLHQCQVLGGLLLWVLAVGEHLQWVEVLRDKLAATMAVAAVVL
jgi:hypothetical protein